MFIRGLYEYTSGGIFSITGEKYIKLGCHTRLLEDWKKDFWNNPNEFPNAGSEKSQLRLAAFEYWVKWFEIIEK